MPIPEQFHYLLELSDEQLLGIAKARGEDWGYALAVLQERQYQDRRSTSEEPSDYDTLLPEEEIIVRQRIKWRRRKLRALN